MASFAPIDAAAADAAPIRRPLVGLAILAIIVIVGFALLLAPRKPDDGATIYSERFSSPNATLDVEVRTPPIDSETRYGVVHITQGGATNVLLLERDEWAELAPLIAKAQPPRLSDWTEVGSVHDTDTNDTTRLGISRGRGIRLVERSRHGPTVEFDLAPSDLPRFNAAVARVSGNLGA